MKTDIKKNTILMSYCRDGCMNKNNEDNQNCLKYKVNITNNGNILLYETKKKEIYENVNLMINEECFFLI